MIKLTFEASNIEEIKKQLTAASLAFMDKETIPAQTEMPLEQVEQVETQKKKPRTKKQEAVKVETADKILENKNKKEMVHDALQKVNVTVGLMPARELLLSFGVQRLSELKEEQYDTFLQRCEEILG